VGGSATYYSYDLNGNCTKIAAPASQTTYFAYNSVNLMARVTFRNGVSNYFSYDALNRRRALVDSNGPAYFMYDQDGLCQLVERNNTGSVRAEYTRGSAPVPGIGDMVAAKINTPTTSYYQYPDYDHRGNVQRIVNAAGAITGSFEYNAWGEKLLNEPPPEGARFTFSAPAWVTLNDDPDERVLLSPTRMFNVYAGMFLQPDPLRFTTSSNGRSIDWDLDGYRVGLQVYEYAHSTPLLFADPKGTVCGIVYKQDPGWDGHGWIEGNGWSGGFWPKAGTGVHLVIPGPGDVYTPDPHQGNTNGVIVLQTHLYSFPEREAGGSCLQRVYGKCNPTCSEVISKLQQYIQSQHLQPPSYSFTVYNCRDWAKDTLESFCLAGARPIHPSTPWSQAVVPPGYLGH
jgi:uncharacterized protein RhaS with RHS repeats